MKTPLFLLLVVLASLLGLAVSQDRNSTEWMKSQKDRKKWCRLNLGPYLGGRC
ncbi:ductus ejaculatorius peptide 99B [Drosophila sechellia]|uniref:GM12229 n=1 Tax=Drosophila sechellia TaxID=7238 RepID=B4HZC8_DROSE|nr:ductus ejaculatorius peptide 99B [Drosophila sechellia]EDW53385.1 GM12229 [Drosophila sechellia]